MRRPKRPRTLVNTRRLPDVTRVTTVRATCGRLLHESQVATGAGVLQVLQPVATGAGVPHVLQPELIAGATVIAGAAITDGAVVITDGAAIIAGAATTPPPHELQPDAIGVP